MFLALTLLVILLYLFDAPARLKASKTTQVAVNLEKVMSCSYIETSTGDYVVLKLDSAHFRREDIFINLKLQSQLINLYKEIALRIGERYLVSVNTNSQEFSFEPIYKD